MHRMSFARTALIAISLGALIVGNGTAARAQPGRDERARGNGENDGDNHNGWRRTDQRGSIRDWNLWRQYDYNRPEPGSPRYFAENYYRGGYRPMPVTRNTRIYRGNNGRFYCRRDDGTTGLIVGATVGGLIGNDLARGETALLWTLLGAGGGAMLGREIERGGVTCR